MNKMSKIHFPTAFGLLILIMAVVFGVVMVKTRTGVNTKAEESSVPKSIKVTNLSDSSFSVSWLTGKPSTGTVSYGEEESRLNLNALDDRDQLSGDTGLFEVHHITVKNLSPSSKYYYTIKSDGSEFDNQGKSFEITTGPTLGSPPVADPVYGKILTPSQTPAEGVVVYVSVANAAPLSALAKTNGNWALSLSTARSNDLSSYLSYDTQATIVNLLVQGGSLGTAPAMTTTANDSPVPEITLGKSHDFRISGGSESAVDENERVDDEDVGGGFEDLGLNSESSDSGELISSSGEVTLDNPSFNGEIINATQPAFVGTGPPGTVLAIEVNSENAYTGASTIDEDGSWEFVPPDGLEVGEHEVSVSYIDGEGIEQVLTRTFIIAAAGESEVPAITATPSGELATDSGRTELPSTESGIPDSGSGEVTLLLLLVGVGLITSGVRLKNKV